MVLYTCQKCNMVFNRKSNFDRHLNKKFDCTPNINSKTIDSNTQTIVFESIQNFLKTYPNFLLYQNQINNESKNISNNKENEQVSDINNKCIKNNKTKFELNDNCFNCIYCTKFYSTKGNLTKHLKNCKVKQNSDNEKENMFKILLEKDKQHKAEINELKEQNKILMKKLDILIKSKNKNSSRTQITNNTQNINSNNIQNINSNNTQNNIVLVNFGKENLNIIDRQIFLDRVIKNNKLSGVKIPEEILKIIHFNPNYPQLSNIYISDINREKCMIFEDGEWKLSSIDKIPEVIDKVILFSNDIETDLKTKYPNNKKLNDRFEIIKKYNNMNDTEYIEELKENIEENKDLIKRCKNFQKMTYDTFKTTLYNEGKKIKNKKI